MNQANFKVTPDLYASAGNRFVNLIIDVIIYYIISFILGLFLGFLSTIGIDGPLEFIISMGAIGNLIYGIVVFVLYYTVMETLTQKSLGKYVTKTIVVLEDGTKPKVKDIFIRSLCRNIPFDHFSFLGSDARGWHDSISETYVVNEKLYNEKRNSIDSIDKIGMDIEE